MTGPILVTGAGGQVGGALAAQAARDGVPVRAVSRAECDLADARSLAACLDAVAPALVINAAAWTAVDAAEAEEAAATRVNGEAPGEIAAWCAAHDAALVHISTDYVFDGSKGSPYLETDATGPTGAYGRSKLAGERAVLAAGARAAVVRTAWVYDTEGRNFLRTMLNLARTRSTLRVVADQRGTPTHAADLALVLLGIARRMLAERDAAPRGLFHATGAGETTWHGFASAIFEERARHGYPPVHVEPIATADWPTPARRPADSRLDCSKLARVFGLRLPDWRESLARSLAEPGALTAHG